MIHSTALIHPQARLADDVEVGAYSIIGADVEIGAGTWIGPHVVINGPTTIGRDNRIYQFASLGEGPQDKKYAGEPTRLEIGDRNLFREYCTLNRGTVGGGGVTRIGSDNWFMAYTHVAHDCEVGDNTIFANAASLGGHVHVGDWAIMGGFAIVHQFCKIGAHAMCGLGTVLKQDIPPYVMADGYPCRPHGINKVGLKRRGFSDEAIRAILEAYKLIYRRKLKLDEALKRISALAENEAQVRLFLDFIAGSERGIIR